MPIAQDVTEHKKLWAELWYRMAEGDIVRYGEIKRMDAIYEFWAYFDLWSDKQNKTLEDYRRKERNLKSKK